MRRLFQSKLFKFLLLFAALCCGLYFGFRRRTIHVYVEKRISAAIGCPVSVRSIVCTPLLSLHLHDFTVGGKADEKNGEAPFFVAETAKLSLLPYRTALCAEGAKICFTEDTGLFPGVFDPKHPDKLAEPVLDYFKEVSSHLGTLRFFLKDAVVTIPTERGSLTLPGVTWERCVLPLRPHNPKMTNVALDENRFCGETTWTAPVLIINNLSVVGAATLTDGKLVSTHPLFLLHNIWQNPIGDFWFNEAGVPSVPAAKEQDASVLEPEAVTSPPSEKTVSVDGHDSAGPVEENGSTEEPPSLSAEQESAVSAESAVILPQKDSDKAEASLTIQAK